MTDIDELEQELQREPDRPSEVLRRRAGLPPEAGLLGEVLDCPVKLRQTLVPPDQRRAWALVWHVLRVEKGVPIWTSAMLERMVSQCHSEARWGGIDVLYGTLLQSLRAHLGEAGSSLPHFLRDLGRTCRVHSMALNEVPSPPPYTVYESLALLYAPGVEHFPKVVHQGMIDATVGSRFADEIAHGLAFDL